MMQKALLTGTGARVVWATPQNQAAKVQLSLLPGSLLADTIEQNRLPVFLEAYRSVSALAIEKNEKRRNDQVKQRPQEQEKKEDARLSEAGLREHEERSVAVQFWICADPKEAPCVGVLSDWYVCTLRAVTPYDSLSSGDLQAFRQWLERGERGTHDDATELCVESTLHETMVEVTFVVMPSDCGVLNSESGETNSSQQLLQNGMLKDGEDLTNLILGCVDEAIICTDLNGVILFWNRFATKLYQWKPEEVLGKNVELIASNMKREQGYEIMEALRKGQSWQGEFLVSKKDGTDFWCYVTDSPIYDRNGKLVGLVGMSSDHTVHVEQRQRLAELSKTLENEVRERTRDLEEANELLRKENAQRRRVEGELQLTSLVATKTDTGVIITDAGGRTLWINDAFKIQSGYALEDLLGKTPGSVLQCEETDPGAVETIRAALRMSRRVCVDVVNKNKSGELYTVNLDIYPVLDDTTSQLKNWFALQRRMDRPPEENAIQEILHKAKADAMASEFKSEFLMHASHEIRTPIVAIIGMATAMLETTLEDTEEVRRDVRTIVNSSQVLLTLVNNMIDLPRIESGQLECRADSFELEEVLKEVCSIVRSLGREDNVDVSLTLVKPLPELANMDEQKLRQVLMNLLNNAVKFSRKSTTVTVTVTDATRQVKEGRVPGFTLRKSIWERRMLMFRIEDQGVGISADKVDELFSKFVQLHNRGTTGTNYKSGTGLGLHICSRLMDLMGGHVWLDKTAVNVGSTFCFIVPVSEGGRIELAAPRLTKSTSDVKGQACIKDRAESATRLSVSSVKANQSDKYGWVAINSGGNDSTAETAGTGGAAIAATAGSPELLAAGAAEGEAAGQDDGRKEGAKVDHQYECPPDVHSPAPACAPATANVAYAKMKVMVCDDTNVNRKVMARMLKQLGIDVFLVSEGAEAVEAFEQHKFDLAFIDVGMPGMDGLEVARAVRASRMGEKPLLVAWTAYAATADRANCLRAGFDDHLPKPVSMVQLRDFFNISLPELTHKKNQGDGHERHDLAPDTESLSLESFDSSRRKRARVGSKSIPAVSSARIKMK